MATSYTFKYQGNNKLKKVREVIVTSRKTRFVYMVCINDINVIIKPDSRISEIMERYFPSQEKKMQVTLD